MKTLCSVTLLGWVAFLLATPSGAAPQ